MVTTMRAVSKEENDAKDDISMETTFYVKDLGGFSIKLCCELLIGAGDYGNGIGNILGRVGEDFKDRSWGLCAVGLLNTIILTLFVPVALFVHVMRRCYGAIPFTAAGLLFSNFSHFVIEYEDGSEMYTIWAQSAWCVAYIMLGCSIVTMLFDFELLYPARDIEDNDERKEE